MNPTLILGLGLGLGAAYLIMRGSTSAATAPTRTVTYTGPTGNTITVQAPNVSASQVQAAIAQQREAMIQRIMTRDHLTRAQAEARYNQLVPAVSAALTAGAPVSGIGGYVRA